MCHVLPVRPTQRQLLAAPATPRMPVNDGHQLHVKPNKLESLLALHLFALSAQDWLAFV